LIKVWASGVWDLFHYGHLNILLKAKAMGDHLTVGVCSDEQVERYKGMKPITNYEDRSAIIKQLRCVDNVVKYENHYDIEQIRDIDIIVLGTDWENRYFPELENALKKLNVKMKYIPYTERLSTSAIKKYIIDNSDSIILNLEKRNQ